MKDNQKEIFPVVDEDGNVIGSATRGECHSGSKLLHPVVHLHVFNSEGQLYLQKRPEWKDIQPGKWDTAVGGHIDYGEVPEDALRREVSEELGITDFTPEFVTRYVFESSREKELVYVYRCSYDGPVKPSASELDGGRFWSVQEIVDAMGKGIMTPNFESEFKRCFEQGAKNKYALFFDIDGTLVSFKTHEIPQSTIQALTLAKENGSRVYIATGRPPVIITNLGAIEHLIDGYITTNGALCYVGNEIVACQAIPAEDVMTCVEDAKAKGYSLIVVGQKDVAVLDPTGDVDRIFRQMLAVKNLDKASPLDVVLQQDILQLTPFFAPDYEADLLSRMPHCVSGRWNPEFTDITANGADKGKGILAMAQHEGFDPRNTMAFGDGGNDTSMIRMAAIGVAMGNALDALKQDADYITDSVDDDGVLNALRHFNVI